MAENARGMLFRKRNILGVALVAGIGLGVYLGKSPFGWFDTGTGTGDGKAQTKSGETHVSLESTSEPRETPDKLGAPDTPDDGIETTVPNVVKVVIDDQEFLLRGTSGDKPITLPQLMKLVKSAPGDADGYRLRIYEKATARVKSEEDLKNALVASGIPDTAVLWVPIPVK